MPFPSPRLHILSTCLTLALMGGAPAALAAPVAAVHEAAQAQQQAMLDTMRDLAASSLAARTSKGWNASPP